MMSVQASDPIPWWAENAHLTNLSGKLLGAHVDRAFHLQLLPIEALPDHVLNVEIIQHSKGQRTLYQENLMSLGPEVELLELCDANDVMITILEGHGKLTLEEEVAKLRPGVFVFIPALTLHALQTQTNLTFLLNRSEPDPLSCEAAWVINL